MVSNRTVARHVLGYTLRGAALVLLPLALLLTLPPGALQTAAMDLVARCDPSRANLLANADFEGGFNEVTPIHSPGRLCGQVADGWFDASASWADVDLHYAPDGRITHGGHWSQRVDVLRVTPHPPHVYSDFLFGQTARVAAGPYRFGVWLRASRPTPITVTLNTEGVAAISQTAVVGPTWQHVTASGSAPHAWAGFFQMLTPQGGETLWIDDADLRRDNVLLALPWLGAALPLAAILVLARRRAAPPGPAEPAMR